MFLKTVIDILNRTQGFQTSFVHNEVNEEKYNKIDKEEGLSLLKGNVRFADDLKHLQLPKLGFVKVAYSPKIMERLMKQKDVKVGTVTIRKTVTDEFFVSLQLASKHPFVKKMHKLPKETAVGIDLNVKIF